MAILRKGPQEHHFAPNRESCQSRVAEGGSKKRTVRARSGVVKALQHCGRVNHIAAGEDIHAMRDSLAIAIITTTIVRF
jgi:hypothetical protein